MTGLDVVHRGRLGTQLHRFCVGGRVLLPAIGTAEVPHAERAGEEVPRCQYAGHLQHYFSSKTELVLYGCRQMVAAAVADHAPEGNPPDPQAARAALIELVGGALSDGEQRIGASLWAAYQAKAVSSPDIAAIVIDALTGRTAALADLLAAACATARRRSSSPTSADRADALRLASLSEGFAQRVLVGAMEADHARGLLRVEVDRCLSS